MYLYPYRENTLACICVYIYALSMYMCLYEGS